MSWLATSVAPASVLILLTGVILVPAGLALLLEFWTRPAAVLLLIVLVPITITVDLGNPKNMGPLFKNVALFGGLIHFAVKGAGAYALDNLRRRDRIRFLRTSGKSCSAISGPP